jgi:hypothetical protein
MTFTTISNGRNICQVGNLTITCYQCGQSGHYANQCMNNSGETAQLQQNNRFSGIWVPANQVQVTNTTIPGTSIDNYYCSTSFTFCEHHQLSFGTLDQSTINIFVNEVLITNICQAKSGVYVLSKGGISYTELVGDLPGYGTVWYNPEGVANIL